MFDITYTDFFEFSGSGAVDGAYYNEKDHTLVVDLHDTLYQYNGVGTYTWEQFKNAPSKGGYYVKNIKPNFGPGERLGNIAQAYFDEVEAAYEAADFGPVGTPKNLTYAENAVVDGQKVSAEHLSLTPAPVRSNGDAGDLLHVVTFETPHGVKTHEVTTSDVRTAKAVVEQFSALLGVPVTVKEVTVRFE